MSEESITPEVHPNKVLTFRHKTSCITDLVEFAMSTLACLETFEEWGPDMLDQIAANAEHLRLAANKPGTQQFTSLVY